MEKNKPLELALDLLKHNNIVCNNEYRFVPPDFGIVISFTHMESRLFRLGQPYRLKEELSGAYAAKPGSQST